MFRYWCDCPKDTLAGMVGRAVDRRRRRVLLIATLISLAITWCASAILIRPEPSVQPVRFVPISCNELPPLIERLEQREATVVERRSVEVHLKCCANCRKQHSCGCPSYDRAFCQ
jgi:hypothetical protein